MSNIPKMGQLPTPVECYIKIDDFWGRQDPYIVLLRIWGPLRYHNGFDLPWRSMKLTSCRHRPTMTSTMAGYIYLGKLSYFTNLNCWAIWGWFPLLTMIPVRETREVVIISPDLWKSSAKHIFHEDPKKDTTCPPSESPKLSLLGGLQVGPHPPPSVRTNCNRQTRKGNINLKFTTK